MFIAADKGTKAVNTDHITSIELLAGCNPPDPEGSIRFPYRIVAHTSDQSTVELVREENKLIAEDMMKTYIRMLNRSDRGEIQND